MYANTHKLPTLWFVSICSTDKQAVLKLLNDCDDIVTGALQHKGCYYLVIAQNESLYCSNLLSSHSWSHILAVQLLTSLHCRCPVVFRGNFCRRRELVDKFMNRQWTFQTALITNQWRMLKLWLKPGVWNVWNSWVTHKNELRAANPIPILGFLP